MDVQKEERFDMAADGVNEKIRAFLKALPTEVKRQTQEIRLRVGRPVTICSPNGIFFLKKKGGLSGIPGPDDLIADSVDLEASFRILCSYSIYSHENEIRNGYVTIQGGHRAGICGTAVLQNGQITGMRDISSVNIRIAREIPGCADSILSLLKENVARGLLLAGPPASGKTTILRDLARQLSSGTRGNIHKIAVVDERGEIAASCGGIPQNNVGLCCDVLDGYPKAEGILLAVRSLSPQVVICDELGTERETYAVEQSLNAGVGVVASMHAGNAEELMKRRQASQLLRTEAFPYVAVLSGAAAPGTVAAVYKAGDLLAQGGGGAASDLRGVSHGVYGIA